MSAMGAVGCWYGPTLVVRSGVDERVGRDRPAVTHRPTPITRATTVVQVRR